MTDFGSGVYRIPSILRTRPAAILAIAPSYALIALAGYSTTTLPEHISAIYPSAGFALAGILIFGYGALPGVLLGSLGANLTRYFWDRPVHHPTPTQLAGDLLIALTIALGATLAAGIAAALVNRFCASQSPLRTARTLALLLAIGAAGGPALSAAVGTLSLSVGGIIQWSSFSNAWLTWWVGDAAGTIVAAPLILAYFDSNASHTGRARSVEAAVLWALVLLVCYYVFFKNSPFPYAVMPLLLWAAFRFDMRRTSTAAAVIALLATIGTCRGSGPFVRDNVNQSLMLLHSFLSVNVVGALLVASVLAERARAEEGQKQSQQLLASTFASLQDAIFIVDAENARIIDCNAAAARIFGYTKKEILDRNTAFLHVDETSLAKFQRELSEKQLLRSFEHAMKRKDGAIFATEHSVAPLGTELGKTLGWVSVVRDISEHKRAEQEQHRLEGLLLQAQKMEAVGQLAGGAAHDFNNILTAMFMQLDLVRDEPQSAEVRALLNDLEGQAKRAAELTRQLLAFSRRQGLQPKSIELNALIENLLKMLGRLIGEHVVLEIKSNPQPLWLIADPGMLEQVVTNLLVNARDAMPKGGRVVLSTEAVKLDAASVVRHPDASCGRFACLAVTDSGTGMDDETVKHIFEPFFTTKEVGKGTGLGLSTVYGIVRQHSGWIEVDSALGQGTTFRVWLPAASNMTASAPPDESVVRGGNECILVVEDDPAVRASVANALERLGYRVLVATNGGDALDRWREDHGIIDVVVSDMIMPGGTNGVDLAEQLRRDKPELPVILMSGYVGDLAQNEAIRQSGAYYLPKPVNIRILTQTLRTALANARNVPESSSGTEV